MSINHYVYLGPYLECEYAVIETQRFQKRCETGGCSQWHVLVSSKYCKDCGQALSIIPETIKEPSVNSWALMNEIDEALSIVPTEYIELRGLAHIWIPNIRRGEPREFCIDPLRDFQVTEIVYTDEISEKNWLREKFFSEIEVLRGCYKRCDIMWGLIVYAY